MEQTNSDEIRSAVRDNYANVAGSSSAGCGGGASSCCGGTNENTAEQMSMALGYHNARKAPSFRWGMDSAWALAH